LKNGVLIEIRDKHRETPDDKGISGSDSQKPMEVEGRGLKEESERVGGGGGATGGSYALW